MAKTSPRATRKTKKGGDQVTKTRFIQRNILDSKGPASVGRVPIVGVGGSAGGLEAFTDLLESLPADIGMAIVLISHLSHTHKSMLVEILSKTTLMPVTEAKRKSINEELETAKEELQATNEELHTVNEELHHRNEGLTEANDDLSNLFESMDIAYLMLGDDLRIRKFTASAKKLFNLIPSDVDRPITDIKPNIDVPDLTEMIAEVIDKIAAKELEVQDGEGRWHSMRIRPYRTKDNRIAGAILALVDIEALKRGRQALRESEAREADLRSLLEETPDFILSIEPEGRVLFINRTFASLAKGVVIGKSIYDYVDEGDHEAIRKCLAEVRTTGEVSSFETQPIGPLRATRRYVTRVGPLKSDGKIVGLTLMSGENPASKRKPKRARR